MKRYRSGLVLSALVAAGAGVVLWDRAHTTTADLEARRRSVWRAFHRERVDRVEVEHLGVHYTLARRGPAWTVRTPRGARPADAVEVERVLSEVEGSEAARTLGPLDAASRQRFGLDHARASVEVWEGTTLTARFSVGGAVEREDRVYVEAAAQEGGAGASLGVVLPKSFGDLFDRDAMAYRDRAVADIDASRLDRIAVRGTGTAALELARRGGVWDLTTPAWGRAARGAVDAMTSQLRELRAERVVGDDLDAATLQRLGLEPPRTRVEFRRGTIEPIVLRLGEACEGHDGEVAAMRDGTGTVVCVTRAFADALRVQPEGLRDDHVVSARTDEISRVRIGGAAPGGAELVLQRTGSQWTALPSSVEVDAEAIESWLGQVHDLAASQRLDGDVRAAHGLEPAGRVIRIEREGVEGEERVRVGAADATGFYASRDDEPIVLRFAASAADTLRIDALRFRPRALVHDAVDDVQALLLDAGSVHEEIVRSGEVFRMSRPFGAEADRALVLDVGRQIATLEVERWVGAELRPEYGLAAPRLRLVARYEGAGAVEHDGGVDASVPRVRTYAFSVGATAPGGGSYATLDGGPGVFVLPRAFVEQISRPHLDHGLVMVPREGLTRLALRFMSPPHAVTLVRDGERWRTEGGAPADDTRVDAMLGQVRAMGAPRVFSYGPATVEQGFAAPSATVEATYAGDAGARTLRLTVGARYGSGEGAGFYVRRDGIDATLSWPESVIDALRGFTP